MLKTMIVPAAAAVAWVAFVACATRIGGAGGGVVVGGTLGVGFAFILGALRTLRSRRYVAATFFLLAFLVTTSAGYFLLDFVVIVAAPELTLTRNFQILEAQLRRDRTFSDVKAGIHREAIGGCVLITGTVDSNEDLTRLESLCLPFGRNAIWNRVRVAPKAKSQQSIH
jgi:hypothetical protein